MPIMRTVQSVLRTLTRRSTASAAATIVVVACVIARLLVPGGSAGPAADTSRPSRPAVLADQGPPSMRAVTPHEVRVGGDLTITGAAFSPLAEGDVVRVGTLDARVVSARSGRLVVAAPPDSGGAVSVTTRFGRAIGPRVTVVGAPSPMRADAGQDRHPIIAPAGVTALAGEVVTAAGRPLAGVRLTVTVRQPSAGGLYGGPATEGAGWGRAAPLGDPFGDPDAASGTATAVSGSDGQWLLEPAPAGLVTLSIDGTAASGGDYGTYQEPVDVASGRTTVLPWLTYLTRIDLTHSVALASPTTRATWLTTPAIPGLKVEVPAGTVVRTAGGQVVRRLSITALPTDRTPFPWGPSMVPTYFTIQPGDATVSGPGLRVIYPNSTGLPAGTTVTYLADSVRVPGTGWYQYGSGRVSPDGREVVPDQGVTYLTTGPGGYTTNGGPPTGPDPGNNCPCGDPVDLYTGLLTDTTTDISLPDIAGTTLTRTFRQNDDVVRDFGIGGSDSLDIYIVIGTDGDFDLYEPDGGKVVFTPTSTTGVYDAVLTPTQYAGAVLTMGNTDPDGPFTLRLKNGTTMAFGNPAFLTSVTDRFGNTLTITRHEFTSASSGGGQIEMVTTSDGRWLQFTYGTCVSGSSVECVTGITDNAGRSTSYTYDASGRLLTSSDPDGGVTTNTWAACTNAMTCTQLDSVRDPAGRTTSYTYDATTGEVTGETLPNGGTWSFSYGVDGSGNSQTIATNPLGTEDAVSFSPDGFPITSVVGYGTSAARTTTTTYVSGTGLPASITDPLGRETTYTYDSLGNTLTVTRLAGTSRAETTTYTYEPTYNRITSVTDGLGHETKTTYDDSAKTVTTTDPLGHATVTKLNAEGQAIEVTSPGGVSSYASYYDGDLVSSADALGNVVSVYYDAVGRPLDITDAEGNATSYTYDADGNRLTTTDPLGATTTDTYDADGDLTSVTDPDGNVTRYTYDAYGDRLTTTDALGNVTRRTFDKVGHPLTVTDPDGSVTTDVYDAFGDLTSSTVSFRSYKAVTLSAYNAGGQRYCEVDPLEAAKSVKCPASPPSAGKPPANVTSTYYNGLGQVVQVTDPAGDTTATGYDLIGDKDCTVGPLEFAAGVRCPTTVTVTTSKDPTAGATVIGYNADDKPTVSYNALGGLTTYAYTVDGKLSSEVVSSNSSSLAPPVTTTYGYDGDDRVSTTTVGSGSAASTSVVAYDPDGHQYCTVSPDAHAAGETCPAWQSGWATTPPDPTTLYGASSKTKVATSFRDPDGRLIQASSADGATTVSAFDPDGHAYCEADPVALAPYLAANAKATYPYVCPAVAPTKAPAAGSDPGYTTYIYNADGEPVDSTDAVGNSSKATYDPDGQPLTVTAPDGGVTTYCYYWQTSACASGAPAVGGSAASLYTVKRPATSADPSGETTTYTYDAGGAVETAENPAGTETFGYDSDGRTVSATYGTPSAGYAQTAAVSVTYGPDGVPSAVTDGTGTTSYTDNAVGQLLSVAYSPASGSKASAYTVGYTWYTNGADASVAYPSVGGLKAGTVTYGYNSSGEESSLTDLSSATVTFGYDPDGNLTSTVLPNGVTNRATFDLADTPTALSASTSSSTLLSVAYTPTAADLVGSESDNGATPTTYSRDLDSRLTAAGSSTQTYNGDGDPTATGSTANTFDLADQLTSSKVAGSTTSYTYDSNGDRTATTPASGSATTYGYDEAGELVSTSAPTATTYTYAATGLRASATTSTGTSTFVYDVTHPLPQLITDGADDYVYGPEGDLIEQVGRSSTTYATTDYQDTPRLLTSSSGVTVATRTYGPFGQLTSSTGAATTPIGYTGGYTAGGSTLVYLVDRYYDPSTEQFLTVDPAVATTGTPYSYAGDDPIDFADPLGLSLLSSLACSIGNAISNNAGAIGAGIGIAAGIALAATGVGLAVEAGAALAALAADAAGAAAADAAADALAAAAADAAADGLGAAAADAGGAAAADAAGAAAADGLGAAASDAAGAAGADGLGAAADAATDAAGDEGVGAAESDAAAEGDAAGEGAGAAEDADAVGEGADADAAADEAAGSADEDAASGEDAADDAAADDAAADAAADDAAADGAADDAEGEAAAEEEAAADEAAADQDADGVGVDRGDGRDSLGRFTGSGGYGASGQAQGLADYETATGRSVVDTQVRSTLPDGSTRYYDGLSPNGDGTYEGVEVKSGSANLSPSQRAFDNQVNSGTPATATLNGQPITVTSAQLVRVP